MNKTNLAIPLRRLAQGSLFEAVAIAQEMGISATTFIGAPAPYTTGEPAFSFLWDELDAATKTATRQLRDQFDRAVIHAPFQDTPLLSPNPYIEREARRQLFLAVAAAGVLNLEVVTVHAPLPITNLSPKEFKTRLVAILQELGDAAATAGTKIGLENWRYPATPDAMAELLAAVDHPAVGVTLDVGHICYWLQNEGTLGLASADAAAVYHERLYAMIERIGAQIIHVHAHDVRPDPLQDHCVIGSGMLNFVEIFNRLRAVDFDGVVLLEVKTTDPYRDLAHSVKQLAEAMSC